MKVEEVLHMVGGAGETSYATNSQHQVTMKVAEVLRMVGGAGETSYATNSWLQENAISKAKVLVQETIADLYCTLLPDSLAITDLGCSSGPNTFTVLSEIIDAIVSCCRCLGRPPPELQFFLNDLPGNDFNAIFRSLPAFEKKVKGEVGEGSTVPFYVVGVPGSFYGRLFPNQSIHFMHSSYSVHWLSQVPQAFACVSDKNIALNKGNIYIAKTSPPLVVESYLEQFRGDLSAFLKLRSEEIISGGRMVLTFLGRKNADATNGEHAALWGLMADALNAMVSEGIVQEAEMQTFNLPFYAASMKEVKLVIQNEGSFSLERENTFEMSWDGFDDYDEGFLFDHLISGKTVSKSLRAVTEPMLACHFGKAIMDDLFSRFAENIARHLLKEKTKYVNLIISLKKRG